MQIGIIGFGQFGQLLSTLLPKSASVLVYDTANVTKKARSLGCKVGSFRDVCSSDIVVFCVPVQGLEKAVIEAAKYVKSGAWVIDVASIKVLPARWMAKHFPRNVSITATHPLFGPQSAKRGLKSQKLVICPIRGRREKILEKYAKLLGLDVVFSDPKSHDTEMAHVQALTHLIGKAIVLTGRPEISLLTEPYKHLIELSSLVEFDTKELFSAIQFMNPYAKKITSKFKRSINTLLKEADPKRETSQVTSDVSHRHDHVH